MDQNKKMKPPKKGKVINAKFLQDTALISWTIKFPEDDEQVTFVLPCMDILGNRYDKVVIDPAVFHKFCKDIIGKEINFIMEELPDLPKNESISDCDGLYQNLREYFGVSHNKNEGQKL